MKWIQQLEDYKSRQRIRYFYFIVLFLLWVAMIGSNVKVKEGKEYSDFEHVALYILEYNDLPSNYIEKGQDLPSDSYYLTFYDVYDNTRDPVKLPTGYTYTEVYINGNTDDGPGAERFVFSNDALYYTLNHYDSFSEVTVSSILGGFYLFRVILSIGLFSGLILIVVMLVFNKEITIHVLIRDIKFDYKLIRERVIYVKDYIKYSYIRIRKKQEDRSPKEE